MMDLRERREKIGISISNVSRICGFPAVCVDGLRKRALRPTPGAGCRYGTAVRLLRRGSVLQR